LSQKTCGHSRRTCCVFNVRGALHADSDCDCACTLIRRWAMHMTQVRNFIWLRRRSSWSSKVLPLAATDGH
jgi:hypothetical protein